MIFGSALSGLNAASTALQVTGNNIANSGTTGFKSSRAEFGDIYAVAYNGISEHAVGQGVRLEAISQNFSQGNVDNTGNNLDLAINGRGFFMLDDGGARVFTRAGAFHVDRDGNVVNSNNQGLLVFGAVDSAGTLFNTADPQPLNVATSEGAPKATTEVGAIVNLSAQADALGAGTIDPTDPTTFTYSTAATVYDSLGASHSTTLYFRKVGNDPGTGNALWDVRQLVDGNALTPSAAISPDDPNQARLAFDSNGLLASPAGGQIGYAAYTPGNGASDLNLALNLDGSTQYGDTSGVNNLTQDGFTTGELHGISISQDGVVSASYTNGQSKALGQIALANFANPDGLQQLGDTTWGETFASGEVQIGAATTSGFGQLQSGGLEMSNVDLSQQLVNLITEQRDFQANAQVITTANNITQTIINLR